MPEVKCGFAFGIFGHIRWNARSNDAATLIPRARTDIDYPIAFCNHLHIVFYHDNCIPGIGQPV